MSCLLACLGLPVWAATLVRSPYLQDVRQDSAAILWTTQELGSGNITVTAPDGSIASFQAAVQRFDPQDTGMTQTYFQYRALATGLKAATNYTYVVNVDGQNLASDPAAYHFQTAATGAVSFLSMGDTGTGSAEQLTLKGLMQAEKGISFILHLGDLGYPEGTFPVLEKEYFAVYSQLMARLPIFPTPGNHEYFVPGAVPYIAMNSVPASPGVAASDTGRYYSFDWGDAHFVSLDSNTLADVDGSTRMLAWLDQDLRTTGKFWKIVYMHHPPYPTGHHLGDPICVQVNQLVNPIVEKYGVQLLLAGHEHGYERTFPLAGGNPVPAGQGTMYVISGGGGADQQLVGLRPETALSMNAYHYLRVDIAAGVMTIHAIGLDGKEFDKIVLAPQPVFISNSIVNSGRYESALASGSLASIFGVDFSPQATGASSNPLPTSLGGVSVTVGNEPAPILFAAPSQINFQIPYDVTGSTTVSVTTPNGTTSAQINVAQTAPSIVAVLSGNSLESLLNPLTSSTAGIIYAVGLGAVQGAVTGQRASQSSVSVPAMVLLDQQSIAPSYAGLAPGFVGLYQVNFSVPPGTGSGEHALSLTAGAAQSSAVGVFVQ